MGRLIQEHIDDAARIVTRRLSGRYTALLLAGAAARGEYTLAPDGTRVSDLDLLVILPQRTLPEAIIAEQTCRRALQPDAGNLARIGASVGFGSAVQSYWRMATPMMWELRVSGQVLDGNPTTLAWPQINHADQIPPWEGIRLVANRITELLALLGAPATEWQLRYASVKLVLACADASLIVAGAYAASYRERLLRVEGKDYPIAQRALMVAAYRAKLDQEWDRLTDNTSRLIDEALDLGLTTLAHEGIRHPDDIIRVTRAVAPAGPGRASDLLYCIRSSLNGRIVALRRPIAQVYAAALSIVLATRGHTYSATHSPQVHAACNNLGRHYAATPQTVGVIE
jgi:hypothetical protein